MSKGCYRHVTIFFSVLLLLWGLVGSAAISAQMILGDGSHGAEMMAVCGNHLPADVADADHCQAGHCQCPGDCYLPAVVQAATQPRMARVATAIDPLVYQHPQAGLQKPPFRPPAA